MKILLISDIHSNIQALDAVLRTEKDSDMIYCTGDLVDVGFYAQEVVDRVREAGVICVQGNHDRKVIRRYDENRDADCIPRDFADLNAQQLKPEAIDYLRTLPQRLNFSHDKVAFLLQHLYRGYELIQTMDEYDLFWADTPIPAESVYRAVMLGHTHHPGIYWLRNGACWINPGSIGYNRPGDSSIATRYATIVDGHAYIHELDHPACRSRVAIGEEFDRLYGVR